MPEHSRSIDPRALARRRECLSGTLPRALMARLAGLVEAAQDARYALQFELDDQGRAVIHGLIEMAIEVRCQRCLGRFALVLRAEPRLVVSAPDEVPAPDDDGLVLAPRATLDMVALVEDELLLALPGAPVHRGDGACRIPDSYRLAAADTEHHRPFEGLAALREER